MTLTLIFFPKSFFRFSNWPQLSMTPPEIMAYIAPSEKASLDIVQSLLRKSNYTAALKYIDILGNNLPIEVLYAAMTYTSYARPALSMHFLRWLRVHRGIVPHLACCDAWLLDLLKVQLFQIAKVACALKSRTRAFPPSQGISGPSCRACIC